MSVGGGSGKGAQAFVNFFSKRLSHHHRDIGDHETGPGPHQASQNALERFLLHITRDGQRRSSKDPPGTRDDDGSTSSSKAGRSRSSSWLQQSKSAPPRRKTSNPSPTAASDLTPPSLLPTFHQVPLLVVLGHAEAATVGLEQLATYVEERLKLEEKYCRERAKLAMEVSRTGSSPDDSLESCLQALALFQDVQTTQTAETVYELDKFIRRPLMELREDFERLTLECRSEMRVLEKDVQARERSLVGHKQGMARLKERRDDCRARLQQARRMAGGVHSSQQGSLGVTVARPLFPPSSAGFAQSSQSSAASLPDPERTPSFSTMSYTSFDSRGDDPELTVIPSLEQRLADAESEVRAVAGGVDAAAVQVLEALGRQDDATKRWTDAFEQIEERRRVTLQQLGMAYVHSETRVTQQNTSHLEKLARMLHVVDARTDMQRFIAHHGAAGGTPSRYSALKLLSIRPSEDGTSVLQPPLSPTFSPVTVYHESSVSSVTSNGGFGGGGSEPPSPERHRSLSPVTASSDVDQEGISIGTPPRTDLRVLDDYGSFEEQEDGEVVVGLLQQLFRGESPSSTPDAASGPVAPFSPPITPKTPGARSSSTVTGGGGRSDRPFASDAPAPPKRVNSFNWDGLTAAAKARGNGLDPVFSTPEERRRFYDRIFAGKDPKGRYAFLQELNQQRSKMTGVDAAGFDELAEIMWKLLLHCQRRKDVHNAKMAMMLSQTFWRSTRPDSPSMMASAPTTSPIPSPYMPQTPDLNGDERIHREYLSKRLIGHPLWSDLGFWDEALRQCVNEQLPTVALAPQLAWHDLDGQARDELVQRILNIVFSQVGALAHSMVEFTGRGSEAAEFVSRVAEKHGLAEEQKLTLLQHCSVHKGLGSEDT